MSKNFIQVIVMLTILFWSLQSYARSCNTDEQDKAEYFAEQAGEKIISEYGGGQDKRTNVTNCEYNTYSETFKLNIEVYFNGLIFRSNNYEIDGILQLKSDGTNVNFSQTYANQQVKDLDFYRKIIGGTLVLGALAASSDSSSDGY